MKEYLISNAVGIPLIKLLRLSFGDNVIISWESLQADEIFKLACKHNVANIIFDQVTKYCVLEQQLFLRWQNLVSIKMMNEAIQSFYLEKITNAFEEGKIVHCVMKGPVIKSLYPRPDYRQSSDLDIFVPFDYRECAKKVLLDLGFSVERYDDLNADDVYYLSNKVIVEVHRVLISNNTPWQNEIQKITKRLVLLPDKSYSYSMTKEDYYLYMIAHMAKHMMYSGFGIKMVLDIWVYLINFQSVMDIDTINVRLKECGLVVFESKLKQLVDYWFYDHPCDDLILQLSSYIINSGSFGTMKQLQLYQVMRDSIGSNSKIVANFMHYCKVFFLSFNYMKRKYCVLEKFPVLLPLCWVHRALYALFYRKEKLSAISGKYDSVYMDDGIDLMKFKKKIGV